MPDPTPAFHNPAQVARGLPHLAGVGRRTPLFRDGARYRVWIDGLGIGTALSPARPGDVSVMIVIGLISWPLLRLLGDMLPDVAIDLADEDSARGGS